uniref:exocyst complex component 3 n=1 Tax=Monopterus albus TaxID=43700 RepID=UPI0009B423E2|nr:exocyst complex component 3-like [Monopterus albus]
MKNIFNKLKPTHQVQRNNSRRPLLQSHGNIQEANDYPDHGHPPLLTQNTFSLDQCLQGNSTLQELANVLKGASDVISYTSEASSPQQNLKQRVCRIIQRSMSEHFPKPPLDLDQNLQQHLRSVQNTVFNEIMTLGPLLHSKGLMGCLIDCYQNQIFNQLESLLPNISSANTSIVLMNWIKNTYQSQEFLGHPDLQKMAPTEYVNKQQVEEWEAKVKDKLRENVQTEIRGSLEKILRHERVPRHHNREEAYVQLYVDTIQCINYFPKQTQNIPELSQEMKAVCFQELQLFVKRYVDEQTETLGKWAKMDKPEMVHFFKVLKTCRELRQYIQTEDRTSLLSEIEEMLENTESSTLKHLMDIVTDMAESHLKNYFKTGNKQLFFLLDAVKKHFPKLSYCQDEQRRVMDDAYKLIVHIYVKHLIKTSQRKLKKCWSSDVEKTITDDAELIHIKISDLAPGVQKRNLLLVKVVDVLNCQDIDTMKLIVATMQKYYLTDSSEDLKLLSNLLQWKGLSKWEVREVLDALPTEHQPRPRSRCWSCCCC